MPNTTHVTQETDQNYGPFKSAFRRNFDAIVQARIDRELSVSFPPHMVSLFVFGGRDPLSGATCPTNAFEEGFSREKCKRAWAKVGAAPLS